MELQELNNMDKKTFIEVINLYKNQQETVDEVSHVIKFDSDLVEFGWIMFEKLMYECFPSDKVDFVFWWLWERVDWAGELYKAYREDGSEIKLDCAEDLWEYLMEE